MSENRLKRFSPHILFILLSIVIPIISVYTSYIRQEILSLLIMISIPIIVMLILFIIGRRHLTGIDIELYGGLSGRFLILSWILFRGFNVITVLFIPLYGFIVPVETFIILFIGSLAYNYIGSANYHILTLIYNTTAVLSFLSIIALYLYLIFIGRRYQEKVMKIYYLIAIILGSIIIIYEAGSGFFVIIAFIQLWFVLATAARWISKIFGIRRKQVNQV